MRPTEATIDLGAIERNVARFVGAIGPTEICAVVKADAYGHGAVAVGRAALAAGATCLAVALVEEGIELRRAGIRCPVLVLSEPRALEMVEVVEHSLTPSLYSGEGLAAAASAAAASGRGVLNVQLKIDTGMRRVGAEVEDAQMLARAIRDKPELSLSGVWTHCAVADEPDHEMTSVQLTRFDQVVAALRADGHDGFAVHAGNTAVALYHPAGHYDMVRVGLGCYGLSPNAAIGDELGLEPALRLTSRVAFVKKVRAGERISYGLRHEFDSDTTVATLPIGYADGIRRSYWRHGGEVLVAGERRPLVGTVTMDQTMVDLGPNTEVQVNDEVVLIGHQGNELITATEVADKLGTISWEVVCDLGGRVRRRYL